ncbi:MAG: hypothetical protein HC921_09270 [Synechococcaceae cyanobacterium SM2_3_1]|nr:hypothetical protein [Synechococcaceae cyanobacterium SM2_3_1]
MNDLTTWPEDHPIPPSLISRVVEQVLRTELMTGCQEQMIDYAFTLPLTPEDMESLGLLLEALHANRIQRQLHRKCPIHPCSLVKEHLRIEQEPRVYLCSSYSEEPWNLIKEPGHRSWGDLQ